MTDPGGPWTADQVETMFHAALEAGDVKGVDAALRVMLRLDIDRAEFLYDALKLGVREAKYARARAGDPDPEATNGV